MQKRKRILRRRRLTTSGQEESYLLLHRAPNYLQLMQPHSLSGWRPSLKDSLPAFAVRTDRFSLANGVTINARRLTCFLMQR